LSAVEVRELARAVIEIGGDLDDLKRLVARWEASIRRPRVEPVTPCNCGKRSREWRLRAPAVDVTYTYLSRKAYREAAAQAPTDTRGVIAKGPASGWVWETAPSEREHAWQCALCHPPANGVPFDMRELAPVPAPSGRLRWRLGHGWRRDDDEEA
jgi:hypothetical protein